MRFWVFFLLIMGLMWSSLSMANVVITGTRVIYPAQNKEIGIHLTNTSSTPALLQAWISHADDTLTTPTPFVITPPILRLDGDKQQTLRVIYTHEPLAQDKETLFYFNLLDIPPMLALSQAEEQNHLQLSLLSKLKFFYRPKNLKPTINKAPEHLTATQHQKNIVIKNPTPYYMTIARLTLLTEKDGTPIAATDDTPMIEPFGQASIPLSASTSAHFVGITLINDYGGRHDTVLPLTVVR